MLVFARKCGETIVFPELKIKIKVIRMKSGGIVSIGIEAPKNFRVNRGAIQALIDSENPPENEPEHPPAANGAYPAPVQIWSKKTGKKIASKIETINQKTAIPAAPAKPNSKGQ